MSLFRPFHRLTPEPPRFTALRSCDQRHVDGLVAEAHRLIRILDRHDKALGRVIAKIYDLTGDKSLLPELGALAALETEQRINPVPPTPWSTK